MGSTNYAWLFVLSFIFTNHFTKIGKKKEKKMLNAIKMMELYEQTKEMYGKWKIIDEFILPFVIATLVSFIIVLYLSAKVFSLSSRIRKLEDTDPSSMPKPTSSLKAFIGDDKIGKLTGSTCECGTVNPEGYRFCGSCGKQPVTQKPQSQSKTGNKGRRPRRNF